MSYLARRLRSAISPVDTAFRFWFTKNMNPLRFNAFGRVPFSFFERQGGGHIVEVPNRANLKEHDSWIMDRNLKYRWARSTLPETITYICENELDSLHIKMRFG